MNLDIYDFSNEQGNDYIRRVDAFIQYIDTHHQQFYRNLSEVEMPLFAQAVAEVMRTYPDMIRPASCKTRLVNSITCYGRRWVNRLDITAFGYETANIARQAITAYQQQREDIVPSGANSGSFSIQSPQKNEDSKGESLLLRNRSGLFGGDRIAELEKRVKNLEEQEKWREGINLT